MPKFNNSDNQQFTLLPPGDYVFEVMEMESGIQAGGGKTTGSMFWEFRLRLTKPGNEELRGSVWEKLIDHPSTGWKIDTFLKSAGAAPAVGAAFEFVEQAAIDSGCTWIDPIGLRGWCHVNVEEYTKSGETEKRRKNKVAAFLTDKPKLPRIEREQPVSVPPPPPAAPSHIARDEDGLPF